MGKKANTDPHQGRAETVAQLHKMADVFDRAARELRKPARLTDSRTLAEVIDAVRAAAGDLVDVAIDISLGRVAIAEAPEPRPQPSLFDDRVNTPTPDETEEAPAPQRPEPERRRRKREVAAQPPAEPPPLPPAAEKKGPQTSPETLAEVWAETLDAKPPINFAAEARVILSVHAREADDFRSRQLGSSVYTANWQDTPICAFEARDYVTASADADAMFPGRKIQIGYAQKDEPSALPTLWPAAVERVKAAAARWRPEAKGGAA